MKKKVLLSGFSLVELSISIAIIALIAGSAISVAITNDYTIKKTLTENKMDRIEEAIQGFFVLNQRLPCPADGKSSFESSDFGLEGVPSKSSCPNANDSNGTVFSGVLPVRSLKLPDSFIFDGWNRRFSYIVDINFANNKNTNTSCEDSSDGCFLNTPSGLIEVKGEEDAVLTSEAIYIVISYGENGHGAYAQNGSELRLNAYISSNPFRDNFPGELENSYLDNSGSDLGVDNVFVDIERRVNIGGEYYDDIVRYKTKSDILYKAGKLWFDPVCEQAKDIAYNLGENGCLGALEEELCELFAHEIVRRCF